MDVIWDAIRHCFWCLVAGDIYTLEGRFGLKLYLVPNLCGRKRASRTKFGLYTGALRMLLEWGWKRAFRTKFGLYTGALWMLLEW